MIREPLPVGCRRLNESITRTDTRTHNPLSLSVRVYLLSCAALTTARAMADGGVAREDRLRAYAQRSHHARACLCAGLTDQCIVWRYGHVANVEDVVVAEVVKHACVGIEKRAYVCVCHGNAYRLSRG